MEPHVAGHSTHFLRRLDRVRQDQVETALALYNDPELLKETLARAQVPEGAARIAIALDGSPEPPHVVVTREGKFVTCLSAGMATSGLFVVSRERLDVAAAHVERMRERLGQVRALEDGGGDVTRQLERVSDAGPAFCREDFDELARWEPLLGSEYWAAQLTIADDVFTEFLLLRRHLRGPPPQRVLPLLHVFWQGLWACSHLGVLSHVGDLRGRIATLGWGEEQEAQQRLLMATLGIRHGLLGPSMRALWCVGRQGRALLPTLKRQPDEGLHARVQRELSLAAVGHASSKSRAEVIRALGKTEPDGESTAEDAWRRLARGHLVAHLEDPDAARERMRMRFLTVVGELRAHTKASLPPSSAEVDEDIGRAILFADESSWVSSPELIVTMVDALAYTVRLEGRAMFPPRSLGRLLPEYSPERAQAIVASMASIYGDGSEEQAVSTKVGRNDPCPCKSGKKHKHCCLKK